MVKIFPSRHGDGGGKGFNAPTDKTEEILRERFARGEIDAEEYERFLEVLRRGRNTARDGV